MSDAWPLVGRREELAVATAMLHDATVRGVVIGGPVGVGKTRLAREVAEAAARTGFTVEWTAGSRALSAIPFGAFAHVLDGDVDMRSDNRVYLLRMIADRLSDRASGDGHVLVVDDAHLLDDASAALVQYVAMQGVVRLMLTTRDREAVPDAVTGLWKDGYVERLELQSLGERDVQQLLADVLDGSVEAGSGRHLWQVTTGNPLFLRELVRAAVEAGDLTRRSGREAWTWRGEVRPTERLRAIVDQRLSRVDEKARSALQHVAVGEPVPFDVLLACCDTDDVALLERSGLIVVDDDNGRRVVRSAHPLYQELVRAELPLTTSRAIMSRLAEALAQHNPERSDKLRVATWLLEAHADADLSTMLDAASVATDLFDPRLAERFARRAIELGGGVRAALMLAQSLNRLERVTEANAVLDAHAVAATTDRERTDIAVARYFGATVAHGFRPEFEGALVDAEEQVTDRGLLAYLQAQRATLLMFTGAFDRAITLATDAVAADADAPTMELVAMRAAPALGLSWTLTGQTDRAASLAYDLLDTALRRAEDMPAGIYWVGSVLMNALIIGGRIDDAQDVIALGRRAAAQWSTSSQEATILAFAEGMAAVFQGHARRAQRLLEDSTVAPVAASVPAAAAFAVEAYAMTGDAERAEAAATEAHAAIARVPAFEGVLRRAETWCCVARGQLARAADTALAVAEWSRTHRQHAAEAFSLHDAVRLGQASRARDRLDQLVPTTEMRWVPIFAAHARASMAGSGTALDKVAAAFDDAGASLRAAEAAAEAASMHALSGANSREARSRAYSQTLLARCDDARPLRVTISTDAAALTARETEVALLAADNFTSAQIAARLFVSRRTVEGHLQRAYSKLGIRDRHALARAIDRKQW